MNLEAGCRLQQSACANRAFHLRVQADQVDCLDWIVFLHLRVAECPRPGQKCQAGVEMELFEMWLSSLPRVLEA